MKYEDIEFIDGIYKKKYGDGLMLHVTDSVKGSLNNPFPKVKIIHLETNKEIALQEGMLGYFGYTEEEVVDLISQANSFNKLNTKQ